MATPGLWYMYRYRLCSISSTSNQVEDRPNCLGAGYEWQPVILRFIDRKNGVTKMALRWLLRRSKKKKSFKISHILLPDKFTFTFYPRPVLAFGYCCCLRLSVPVCLSVCLSVCVSVNQVLVRVNGDNSSLVQVGSTTSDVGYRRAKI